MVDLSGCTFEKNDDFAKNKLEEKYNESFEVEKILEGNIVDGYYTALAYPSNMPDILFTVSVDFDGSVTSDNYVCKRVFKKMSERIGNNLDDLNGCFYIYCAPLVELRDLDNPEMDVEEYLKLVPENDINIYLHYSPDGNDFDNLYCCIQSIYNGIGNEKENGMIYLFIVDDNGLDTAQDYLESHDRIYAKYHDYMEPYYKGYIRVKDGKPECTKEEFMRKVGDK